MMCCVITRYHGLVGVDVHAAWPTMPILPSIPMAPHYIGAVAQWGPWWMAKDNMSPTVDTAAGLALSKKFDIGMFIPHLGLNNPLLLGILLLTSSSQGHFGVSRVLIGLAGEGSSAPVAASLMLIANPQLDCGDISFFPVPMPTGLLMTPNTVVAGMTIGDMAAGFLSMALTSLFTAAIGKFIAPLVKGIGARGVNALSRFIVRRSPWIVGRLTDIAYFFGRAEGTQKVVDMILSFMTGSPTGYGVDGAPLGTKPGELVDWLSGGFGEMVDGFADQWGLNDYFNDTALIPTFPSPMLIPGPAAEGALEGLQVPLAVGKVVYDAESSVIDPITEAMRAQIKSIKFPWPSEEE